MFVQSSLDFVSCPFFPLGRSCWSCEGRLIPGLWSCEGRLIPEPWHPATAEEAPLWGQPRPGCVLPVLEWGLSHCPNQRSGPPSHQGLMGWCPG